MSPPPRTSESLARRIRMARGLEPADLCVEHVNVVDVFSRTLLRDISVTAGDGVFLGFGPSGLPARRRMDARGRFMLPGLMDAHLHLESTMLTPAEFARLVVPHGTAAVVADPHEIANVLGLAGLRYLLESSRDLPLDLRLALPSCVPCTPFEDSGAVLAAADLAPLMGHERVCALGEMMNYPGLLAGDPAVLDKIALARASGKRLDGHAPGLLQARLDAYCGTGVASDHECESPEEVVQRLARGMYVFVRHGSAARNLPALLRAVHVNNAHRCCFCTDDSSPADLLERGHMDEILRLAVAEGLDPLLAVGMAALNGCVFYGMRDRGGIAPGWAADFCLVDDLRGFRVREVFRSGRQVAQEGHLCVELPAAPPPSDVLDTIHIAPLTQEALRLPVPSGRARVMGLTPQSLITRALILPVALDRGCFDPQQNPGLAKIAVVERHKATGKVGVGILRGYLRPDAVFDGAIATSIAHDSHNIVVAGGNDRDMLAAVESLRAMGGGICCLQRGRTLAALPLPVAGLISPESCREVAARKAALLATARRHFALNPDLDPVMALSFMALPVIPELKLTARGLFDVQGFSFVPVDAEKA